MNDNLNTEESIDIFKSLENMEANDIDYRNWYYNQVIMKNLIVTHADL